MRATPEGLSLLAATFVKPKRDVDGTQPSSFTRLNLAMRASDLPQASWNGRRAPMTYVGRSPAGGDEQEEAAALERRRRLSQDVCAGGTGAYWALPGVVSTAPGPKRGWDATGSDSIL